MVALFVALAGSILSAQDPAWVGKTRFFGANDDQCVYEVKEDNVTLDFKGGVILSGKPVNPDRSQLTGTGLLIQNRKNVTIKNLNVKGYRFNVRVVNCENVRLINCQASASRTLRMANEGKAIDTFLDLRNIETWRTYGAGFWIEGSKDVSLTKCSANDAQNGVILVDSTGCTLLDNDFSFNSGWGICLGRSSDNQVIWNRADFCNRPWSGFWGGDSAGIAVADSSHRNYFVGNSMTHSGDGFFLTHKGDQFNKGTKTVTLHGPSNDNVIAYNDGSWSTANAFEGTFSTGNVYYQNWACDSAAAGFWLGYSDNSLVLDNKIYRDGTFGVAIEHGKQNLIQDNVINGTKGAAVGLWASGDWKAVARPSERNDVVGNKLKDNALAYDLRNGRGAYIKDTSVENSPARQMTESLIASSPNTSNRSETFIRNQLAKVKELLALRPKDYHYYREMDLPKGIGWLQAGDWAPTNFAGQLAAWRQPDPGCLEMYLLEAGVRIAAPNFVQYDPTPEDPHLVRISMKPEAADPGRDQPIQLNMATTDSKRRQQINTFLRTAVWNIKWFAWPRLTYDDVDGWKALFAGNPIATQTTRVLGGDFTGRSPMAGVPSDHFALAAETKVKLEPGKYVFSSLSDDGIRVFLDGQEIISRWNHHGPTPDEATVTLDDQPHVIRVEYCQESGSAVLHFDWRKT